MLESFPLSLGDYCTSDIAGGLLVTFVFQFARNLKNTSSVVHLPVGASEIQFYSVE